MSVYLHFCLFLNSRFISTDYCSLLVSTAEISVYATYVGLEKLTGRLNLDWFDLLK